MGMFDWVKCDIPLPKMDWEIQSKLGYAWQTKSLERCMDYYTITSGGILLRKNPYSVDRVYDAESFTFYHTLDFKQYPITSYRYQASFKHGELRSIELVEKNGKTLEQIKEEDEECYRKEQEYFMNTFLERKKDHE